MPMNEKMAATEADEIVGKRGGTMIALGLAYLPAQYLFAAPTAELLGFYKSLCWVVITLSLLIILLNRGHLLAPQEVRERLEDESTRTHRALAGMAGLCMTVMAGLVAYTVNLFWPIPAHLGLQMTLASGLSAALIRFGWLERAGSLDE